MKIKKVFLVLLWLGVLMGATKVMAAEKQEKSRLVNQNLTLTEAVDLHLTDAAEPMKNSRVNLASGEAWLFFDHVRPSVVLKRYAGYIQVMGQPFVAGKNGRVAIYKQGAVVIPQTENFFPLQTFAEENFGGDSVSYDLYQYYTNHATEDMPAGKIQPLIQDNAIRSLRLKRGYMATVATQPDGMGYSRVFIADTADIELAELPVELDGKVSYIRVFAWQWPSKKGWCGVWDPRITVATNGKNKQANEMELTQSTWVYSWGTADPIVPDWEFVPMKWGLGGSFEQINAKTGVTHLLGYNEPNRPDQSDMSVEQALEEWPKLMRSGLRLGSPSVSDNSRLVDWLYRFMDECEKRNYRVDYVPVHAYWGSQQARDPRAWYNMLKEIHQRTGRPIWLTEWNNGANWTHESWPSGRTDQFDKQWRELREIIQVLDTASFIERYSIYNWVEDKRAVILDSFSYKTVDDKKITDKLLKQTITPAGVFYRDNHPDFAFRVQGESVPGWTYSEGPRLAYSLSGRNEMMLKWTLAMHPEMIKGFVVERSEDGRNYKEIQRIAANEKWLYFESLKSPDELAQAVVYYRIQLIGLDGKTVKTSNCVSYHYLDNETKIPIAGNLVTGTDWTLFAFEKPYTIAPIIVCGTPTNRNKVPQTHRINNLGSGSFDFKFKTWEYLNNPLSFHQDTIACLLLPEAGGYKFKGIEALAGKVEAVAGDWVQVIFDRPFKEMPVVFATQVTNRCDSASSVRVRNVSAEGFEMMLQYEAGIAPPEICEEVCYLALTPGQGLLNGKKMEVGRTADHTVGDFFKAIHLKTSVKYCKPAFFGAMQTVNDEVTSALRIKKRGSDFIEVFKEKELSGGAKPIAKEMVGWMVIETAD